MDSSKYVTANNYILEKNFVKLMARLLNLASNRSRAALYTFGDLPQLEISFDGYQDREAFDAAVNKAPHLQGNRRIDKALESAAELLKTKSRATVPKYVVLFTTGTQTVQPDARSLVDASRVIRSYGGRVFVVAILIGGYTINEFYPAVQRLDDAFPVSSFTNLLPRAPSIAARIMASWRKLMLILFVRTKTCLPFQPLYGVLIESRLSATRPIFLLVHSQLCATDREYNYEKSCQQRNKDLIDGPSSWTIIYDLSNCQKKASRNSCLKRIRSYEQSYQAAHCVSS